MNPYICIYIYSCFNGLPYRTYPQMLASLKIVRMVYMFDKKRRFWYVLCLFTVLKIEVFSYMYFNKIKIFLWRENIFNDYITVWCFLEAAHRWSLFELLPFLFSFDLLLWASASSSSWKLWHDFWYVTTVFVRATLALSFLHQSYRGIFTPWIIFNFLHLKIMFLPLFVSFAFASFKHLAIPSISVNVLFV